MFENLPLIDAGEFPHFAAMCIRDFPPSYEVWFRMIKDRHRDSVLREGIEPKMIRITAIEYARFCDLRQDDMTLKSIERLVEEKAAGTVF